MTRQEQTKQRDFGFSSWIRQALPNSHSGYRVSDIDFVFCNVETKKVMLIELKTHGAEMKPWQKELFNNFHIWIKEGIKKTHGWTYLGFRKVEINKVVEYAIKDICIHECPDMVNIGDIIKYDKKIAYVIEGDIRLDNNIIKKEDFIKELSF